MTWIPIEKMPESWKDGRWVLFCGHGGRSISARKDSITEWWHSLEKAYVEEQLFAMRLFTHCAEIPKIEEE